MSSSNSTPPEEKNKDKKVSSPQEILDGFRKLREEQRHIAGKIHELEADRNEHRLVIETLEEVDGERKCFRLVSGVLVERSVKEVLPALRKNVDQVSTIRTALSTLSEQLVDKGREINNYREKHNIRIQGEDDSTTSASKHSPSDSEHTAKTNRCTHHP